MVHYEVWENVECPYTYFVPRDPEKYFVFQVSSLVPTLDCQQEDCEKQKDDVCFAYVVVNNGKDLDKEEEKNIPDALKPLKDSKALPDLAELPAELRIGINTAYTKLPELERKRLREVLDILRPPLVKEYLKQGLIWQNLREFLRWAQENKVLFFKS